MARTWGCGIGAYANAEVGLLSGRPAATGSGLLYYATDTSTLYVDDASGTWATAGGGSSGMTIISQGGTTYTLQLSDAGAELEFTSASAVTVTVPPNSSVNFPVGSVVVLRQTGTGRVTASAGAGVTLHGSAATAAQYGTVTLVQGSANVWYLTNNPQATGGGLLGSASFAESSAPTTSTTQGTVTDVDATNLAITFTAPASGAVNAHLCGWITSTGTSNTYEWGVRDSSNTVWGPLTGVAYSTGNMLGNATIRVTGLTAGTSYTFKWCHTLGYQGTASTSATLGTGANNPLTMEVFSA